MNKTMIKGEIYYKHPRYDYGCDRVGQVINLKTLKKPKEGKDELGYIYINLPTIFFHRKKYLRCIFNYECFNNKIINDITMHVDGNKVNDSMKNLLLMP